MSASDLPDGLAELIPPYLGRQRWYAGSSNPARDSVRLLDGDVVAVTGGGNHRLLQALVDAEGARYHLLIGERQLGDPAEFLNGHEPAVLGECGSAYYYDGTLDPEMAHALLTTVTDGQEASTRVRPVTTEQSNTSLVYDDRIILKVFRRLVDGVNPDVEVTTALAATGFTHVAAPVAIWRRDDFDLAFAQRYLAGGSEGWALALTSLRDYYGHGEGEPSDSGGDFGAEAARLGRMTAEMHLALAPSFGVGRREDFRAGEWPNVVNRVAERLRETLGAAGSADDVGERLRSVKDPGPAIRVHGDYHLGQVMRTDTGWYVLDFEGEPARPMEERLTPTSPIKDVTGMLRSFQYAAHFVLLEREADQQPKLEAMAGAWEAHNRSAFLNGYLATSGIDDLLPVTGEDRAAVTLAFELDKALYELAYEQAYRPGWVDIPRTAIRRVLSGSSVGPAG